MRDVTETAFPGAGLSIPQVVDREEIPYLAIRAQGAMRDLPHFAPQKFPQLHQWMRDNGASNGGLGFFRYRSFDAAGHVELDVGTTTERPEPGGGDVLADVLPAGRYAVATYSGPYDRLHDAFLMLEGWMDGRGLAAEAGREADGFSPSCQVEFYRVSPMESDNPADWRTDIMLKLRNA